MIELQEVVQIALPAQQVWSLITSPLSVASCISGATLEATDEPDLYRGTMRVKFGPTVVTFHGEARTAYEHSARRCTIAGRGHDKRGATNATATIQVQVSGEDTAELAISGGFAVTGPLEGFARTGGVHIARILLKDFAANLALMAKGGLSAEDKQTNEPLNAAGVAGQAARQWISGILTRKD